MRLQNAACDCDKVMVAMAKDPVPEMLARATEALEAEFGAVPEFEAEPEPGAEAMAAVLNETAQRLGDNYPYFHPLYAGQMLKPPHLVARVKQENPALEIVLNGGIHSLEEAETHLTRFDGVMLGRAAYQNPAMLLEVDERFFGAPPRNLDTAIEGYCDYIERKLVQGVRLHSMTKHMLGLFNGRPGARAFRRHLSENAMRDGAGIAVLREALTCLNLESQAA